MRIAFDGKKAANNRAGLGNYSRFVIRCLAERYPDMDFDIYLNKEKDYPLLAGLNSLPNVHLRYPKYSLWRWSSTLWSLFGLPAELKVHKPEIFHGLGNELPWNIGRAGGVMSVVTIHDLIFLSYPHTYSWIDRHLYNIKFRHACKVSDRIIAVSKCTAADIMKYYFTDRTRISVAYQGCDSSFRICCSESFKDLVRHRFSLPRKYLLSVGTIEERKNTVLIVEAMAKIPDIDLVLVGKRTGYTRKVVETAAALGLSDRVHILSGVGFKELPAIYQMAEVFIYPSHYEGFGIPVLEALCCGVPVIAATGSCLEEVGGDAAAYIDPDNAGMLAETVLNILNDGQLRNQMIEKGFQHSSKFTDRHLAECLMEIYESMLK